MSQSSEYSEVPGNRQDPDRLVIVLTEEDKRVYKQCSKKHSVIFFSIPWTIAGAGLGVLVKRKIPTLNWPLGFGILALISSRIYARTVCFAEMMRARDSNWNWSQLPKKATAVDEEFVHLVTGNPNVKLRGTNPDGEVANTEDAFTQNEDTLQFDEYKPMDSYEGYSSFNNSSDTSSSLEVDLTEIPQASKRVVSYDELRARNRAQYAKVAEANKTEPPRSWTRPPRTPAPEPPSVKVNEYGDAME